MIFGQHFYFWLAVIGAALLKMALSPWAGAWKGSVSIVAAVFIAVTFTDSVLSFFVLDPAQYKNAVAALVTLTGEGLVRWLLQLIAEPKRIIDLIKTIRGGGSQK